MDDLNDLRKQYNHLHRELTNRQHVLNSYLKGKLPTQTESRELNERHDSVHVTSDGNTQWTSTPMRRPARSHTIRTPQRWAGSNGQTPSKRKSDAETPRLVGRGSSLVHHGSESKRLRSMGSGARHSSSNRMGSVPRLSFTKSPGQRRFDSRIRSPLRSLGRQTRLSGAEKWNDSEHRQEYSRYRSPQITSNMTENGIGGTERQAYDDDIENVGEGSYVEQLLSQGNSRLEAARSREVNPNPRSILHTPGGRPKKTPMRVSFLNRLNRGHQSSPIRPLPRSLRTDSLSQTTSLQGSVHDRSYGNVTQPLLGYDWIAGLMDTNPTMKEKSDAYLEEIKQFRQMNRDECVHTTIMDEEADEVMNVSQGYQDDPEPYLQAKEHKCIHNYALNDRLFAVPLHENNDGESLCAICQHRRSSEKKSLTSPSYVRVSIPRSTLASPYHVRPHRRSSFDPTDSMGLSQHCLAGWQNSRPSMMPQASTIDLKASLDKTMVTANSLFDPTLGDVRDSAAGRPLGPSRRTQDLLNRSHAMRVDLQRLERAGLSMATSNNISRNYPLL